MKKYLITPGLILIGIGVYELINQAQHISTDPIVILLPIVVLALGGYLFIRAI